MSTLHTPADRETDAALGCDSPVRTEERRDHLRRDAGFWVSLMSLDGSEVIRSRSDNVGEGGLRLTTPVGYGFAVGQRYEVLMGKEEDPGDQGGLTGEGHYATVVRTEFIMGDRGDQVGVGLRFDQPVIL